MFRFPPLACGSECREDPRTPLCVLLIPEAPQCQAVVLTLLHVRLPGGVFEDTDTWIPHPRSITSECLSVRSGQNIFLNFCKVENHWCRGMRPRLVVRLEFQPSFQLSNFDQSLPYSEL